MKLCNELNAMECRPPRSLVHISGELSSGNSLSIETKESFADNPLVVGQRYQPQDFSLSVINNPGFYCSGVVVVFTGSVCREANDFRNGQHLRSYEIKGRFGFATHNNRSDGKIFEKSYYKHIREGHIGRVVSKIQATHQTLMFKSVGVDVQSQEAYEMASKGMVRPLERKSGPIVYGIRLTEFRSPDFTLEIDCINEFDEYLFGIIANIGIKLKSSAMCTGLRLIRFGPFTVEHSLLSKHWTSEHIIENIKTCEPLLKPHLFRPLSPLLSDPTVLSDHDIFLETLEQKGEIIK